MLKRLIVSVIAALALVVPASAYAEGREYGTENAKGVFKAFGEGKKEKVIIDKASPVFTLQNEAKTADIHCSTFGSEGYTETNTGGVGQGEGTLIFAGCEGGGELAGCVPNSPTTPGEILGQIGDEVDASGSEVTITILSGFDVNCFGVDLGSVTGKANGSRPPHSNVGTFSEAAGLKFLGQSSTITGAFEVFKGAKAVVIGAEPGLQPTAWIYTVTVIPKGIEKTTVVFVNNNMANAVTVTAEPVKGGEGSWSEGPMQGAEACKKGKVIPAKGSCTFNVTFNAGAKPEGGGYDGSLTVSATTGGGTVTLEGVIEK
jgi:hypothetical protein